MRQTDNIVYVYRLGSEWGADKKICNKFEGKSTVTALAWPRNRPHELAFGLASGKVGKLKSRARDAFQVSSGVLHPAPAPRFDRTQPEAPSAPPPQPGEQSDAILREFGFDDDEIRELRDAGALA